MSGLKPWTLGPFELLRHAEGHLKVGADFDKRMALISFDNAIEVAIATFLQLHPKQRGNKEYKREQVTAWQANYHTKLDFFYDHYLPGESIDPKVSRDEVIWYHDLRNQLYHSGNGMVPEENSLLGAREGAIWVFSMLYNVDADALLKIEVPAPLPVAQAAVNPLPPQMQFLEAFIEFEKLLREATTDYRAAMNLPDHAVPIRTLWPVFKSEYHAKDAYDGVVSQALLLRNEIAHGKPVSLSDEEAALLTSQVKQVSDFMRAHNLE